MAENRHNDYSILLTIPGKKSKKIELFSAEKFKDCPPVLDSKPQMNRKPDKRYRIRIDGKWHPEGERKFYYRGNVMDIIMDEIEF